MLCNFAPTTLSQFAIQVDTAMLLALEGGGSPSTVLQGHFTPERHKSDFKACLCLTVSSPCIIKQTPDFVQHKATKVDHYQITLIYLDNLKV